MRINHNIAALKASNSLGKTNSALDKSLERLSSGYRINRAADDAAGMAISHYTEAAKVADEEGFPEIAEHFRSIAEIENHHRMRFLHYLEQVKNGTVWKRDKPIQWQCLVCGYIYEGTEPPKVCPACDHPYQHYMALDYEL